MPVAESGERDTSTPNRNTVTANPQKNANTMAAHCAPRVLALFSLSPAFWSTHTACSSATCGPRGPTRRMDQPESAYTSAVHASSGRIAQSRRRGASLLPHSPAQRKNGQQKNQACRLRALARQRARGTFKRRALSVCVLYILYSAAMDQMGQMGMYQGQMGMAQQQAPPAQSMGGNEGPPGCNLFIYHCPPSVRAVHGGACLRVRSSPCVCATLCAVVHRGAETRTRSSGMVRCACTGGVSCAVPGPRFTAVVWAVG